MIPGDDVRAVLRRFPFGVSVVTVDLEGERVGLTVASLVSLSLDPALVGISIARQAALHELLRGAAAFSVSLLAADQAPLAQHFARGVPPIAIWSGIELRSDGRAPLLAGAIGWLECDLEAEHAVADHTLFVGSVARAQQGRDAPPLLRLDGTYRGT
ncbi:MAG: flavin reductase family protein [Actinobacteria bacterium]|nr:flavin reductase family protein [Actinomycetota bacterium]